MKTTIIVIASTAALLMAGQAAAQEEDGRGMGIGAKVGTMGLGIELTKSFTDTLNGRIGFNNYSYSDTDTVEDIDYDIDLQLRSFAGFLDWHPGSGGFRMSLGYFVNNNELDMTGKPASGTSFEINNVTYNAADVGSLNGNVNLNNGAYLGIGWGNAASRKKGWGFVFDAGVVAQGSPDLSLRANGPITDPTSTIYQLPAYDPAYANLGDEFAANLAQEEKNGQGDLDEFKIYPVISLGVSYAF